jgi:hypothetical protein
MQSSRMRHLRTKRWSQLLHALKNPAVDGIRYRSPIAETSTLRLCSKRNPSCADSKSCRFECSVPHPCSPLPMHHRAGGGVAVQGGSETSASRVRLHQACETAGIGVRTLECWKARQGLLAGDGRPTAVAPSTSPCLGACRARVDPARGQRVELSARAARTWTPLNARTISSGSCRQGAVACPMQVCKRGGGVNCVLDQVTWHAAPQPV